MPDDGLEGNGSMTEQPVGGLASYGHLHDVITRQDLTLRG